MENIGLPSMPSMRGATWEVDAPHCQGCSVQFTFFTRKHHCRRCGGVFCNSCTQQRMVLRGQGDSPVRICDPCKKLEEAARYELRYGHKSIAARESSKSCPSESYCTFNHVNLLYLLRHQRRHASHLILSPICQFSLPCLVALLGAAVGGLLAGSSLAYQWRNLGD